MNTQEQISKFEQAINDPMYSHCRARSWRASGHVESDADYIVWAYVRGTNGVTSKAFLNGLQEATEVLDRNGKVFPLSPTEKN